MDPTKLQTSHRHLTRHGRDPCLEQISYRFPVGELREPAFAGAAAGQDLPQPGRPLSPAEEARTRLQ